MNRSLLQQVYQMYSREIRSYLYMMSKNAALAEDLTQETFLKAILSLPNTHSNIRAWLYTVARNLYLNFAKAEKHPRAELDESMADPAPQTEDAVIQRLMNEELYRAMLALDPTKREVLLLQYFSGMPQKEIAALLNMSHENVRVLSFRAKKELRQIMEGKHHDIP